MRVPFQNLMEETKRKSSMQVSQSNSRYCSSSKSRDSEKVMMKYSRMAMRILAELPSVRITCIVHKFFNDITHIQNIAVLECFAVFRLTGMQFMEMGDYITRVMNK